MNALTTYYFSAATLSWIDPRTGLPEVDQAGEPAGALSLHEITEARNCRFANLLSCSIVVRDGRIVSHATEHESGLYTGISYMDTLPQSYKIRRDFETWDARQAIFVQTVGSRTMAPEIIGGLVGGVVGGAMLRDNFNSWSAKIGREVAELVTAFPPIWTTLRVTMRANGIATAEVVAHSLFPSLSYYESIGGGRASTTKPFMWVRKKNSYDAVAQLSAWKKLGWGRGNPWLVQDPSKVRNNSIR